MMPWVLEQKQHIIHKKISVPLVNYNLQVAQKQ